MNNNYEAPPFVQRNISNADLSLDFFNIFEKKYLKLGLAFFSAMVSIIGNFYAIKQQIHHMRLDMLGNDLMISMYAIGITFLLDTMIIVFHLMKMKNLASFSTFSALAISIYANIMLAIQTPGGDKITTLYLLFADPSVLLTIVIGFCMAILPVLTIVYLMNALTEQIDNERKFNIIT